MAINTAAPARPAAQVHPKRQALQDLVRPVQRETRAVMQAAQGQALALAVQVALVQVALVQVALVQVAVQVAARVEENSLLEDWIFIFGDARPGVLRQDASWLVQAFHIIAEGLNPNGLGSISRLRHAGYFAKGALF